MFKPLSALFLPLVLLFGGCATVKETLNVQKPTADVAGVKVTGMSLDAIDLLVDLDISNPNAFALATSGFDLDLQVQQRSLATLQQTDSKLSLPAKGKASTAVPVSLKIPDILKVLDDVKDKQQFSYAIDAGFTLNLPVLGNVRIPVSYEAVLPIPAIPKFSLASARLDKVGFSGAEMTLVLDIINPNRFGIDLNKLDYQVVTGNSSLLSGAVKSITLKENGSSQVEIPVKLSLTDAGSSLLKMLSGKEPVQIGLRGNLDYQPDLPLWKPDPLQFDLVKQLTK